MSENAFIRVPKNLVFLAYGLLTENGTPIASSIRREKHLVEGDNPVDLWIVKPSDHMSKEEEMFWLSNND